MFSAVKQHGKARILALPSLENPVFKNKDYRHLCWPAAVAPLSREWPWAVAAQTRQPTVSAA